ncbi:hypothetical protein RSO01_90240 [Reyranella soli]|uniref:Uncharacterized protein n=2 Tax=Reyranella soli TaxID=1230389 RepID=A0A512NSB5_9HYPH|nr:hypothetical protein RSO01_90240 [Reyranella soli]
MRRSGPFRGDVPSPEKSLHFWHNNFGKRSIVVDLDKPNGQEAFVQLASATEAVLSLRERGLFHHRGSDRFRTLDSLKLNSRAACGTVGGQQVVIFCKMTECAHSGFCNGRAREYIDVRLRYRSSDKTRSEGPDGPDIAR